MRLSPGIALSALGRAFGGFANDQEALRQRQRQATMDTQSRSDADFQRDFQLRQAGYLPSQTPSPDAIAAPFSSGNRSYAFDFDQSPQGRIEQRQIARNTAEESAKTTARQTLNRAKYNTLRARYSDDPLSMREFDPETDYTSALTQQDALARDAAREGAIGARVAANRRPPTAPRSEPIVQVEQDGKVVYVPRSQAAGMTAPSKQANARTSAAMQGKVVGNQTQIAQIDKAIAELDAHPAAVGMNRGLGELPFMGNIADSFNQRKDPGGIAARAQITNVGSMVVHDRSGAAVTVSEYPRLAPFVPKVTDTPEAIKIKLGQLRAALELEANLYEQNFAPRSPGPRATPPSASPSLTPGFAGSGDIDLRSTPRASSAITPAERAALKARGFTDAQITAKYGPGGDE